MTLSINWALRKEEEEEDFTGVLVCFFLLAVLGIKLRVSYIQDKHMSFLLFISKGTKEGFMEVTNSRKVEGRVRIGEKTAGSGG